MNLFTSKIIPAAVDARWSANHPLLSAARPAGMAAVSRPFSAGSPEETTLKNMLAACGFGANSAIVQLPEDAVLSWTQTHAVIHPGFALLLGISPVQLGIEAILPPNAPSEFGGATFILTPDLETLTAREDVRKALWTGILKPLFAASR